MKKEIWIFLFFVGLLLFNWPFLHIFERHLPAYLFSLWLAIIGLVYFFSSHGSDDGGNR